MNLLLHDIQPIHWGIAGALIAAVTIVLQALANRSLGISTIFEDFCSLVSDARYFKRQSLREEATWRWPFAIGLITGGVVSSVTAGDWQVIWNLGLFDQYISSSPVAKLAWMFVGGIAIGYGTRMAGGCTSGHGIFGIATLQKASFRSVIAFMATGIVVTNLVYRVFGGLG